ncbi:hypothetical protein TNCV_3731931 [Trichonephila clavipes]|nr:hypothetical protein TNCV_3731931 [Trichonephila clavipes]
MHVKSVESSNDHPLDGGASSGVYHVTRPWFKITRSVVISPNVAEQCDVNIHSLTQRSPRCAEVFYVRNLGYTAYMNTIVQFLSYSTQPSTFDVIGSTQIKKSNKPSTSNTICRFICAHVAEGLESLAQRELLDDVTMEINWGGVTQCLQK